LQLDEEALTQELDRLGDDESELREIDIIILAPSLELLGNTCSAILKKKVAPPSGQHSSLKGFSYLTLSEGGAVAIRFTAEKAGASFKISSRRARRLDPGSCLLLIHPSSSDLDNIHETCLRSKVSLPLPLAMQLSQKWTS